MSLEIFICQYYYRFNNRYSILYEHKLH